MSAKVTRWLAVYDSHGDHIDPSTREVILRFKRAWKPDLIIHGGDAFDFRSLRDGATDAEQREELDADIEAGCSFLSELKPHVWTRGNHCERLWRQLDHEDPQRRKAARADIAKIKSNLRGDVKMLPYHKRRGVFRFADTNFLHGFFGGEGAARRTAQVYGKSCAGHAHTPDVAVIPHIQDAACYLSGSACVNDQTYNERHAGTLRQRNGFLFGLRLHGELIIHQAQKHADQTWLLPTGFQAFHV